MSTSSITARPSRRAVAPKAALTAVARQPTIATLSDDQARRLGQAAGRLAFDAAIDAGLAVPMLSAGKLTAKTKPAG